jgi:predicted MPP superfamily phosphohydrolase
MFKLLHLSDFHFHGGASQANNHRHSIDHLKGINEIVKTKQADLDLVIISGDLSDYGDNNSLLLARQWIYGPLEIGNGEKISLGISQENQDKIRIIPGNHDAWNSSSKYGKTYDRRQKSIENFSFAFPESKINNEFGCYVEWIEKDGNAVFLCFLDSSYLGDPELEKVKPDIKIFDKIAKGKISAKQSEYILEIFDKGIKGNLKINEKKIDKGEFQKALKILVMHHYLFEPLGYNNEPLMHINHRDTTFRNIALADFDILLCGHKHIADFKDYQYIHYFKKKQFKFRYLLNYFRRIIGTYSMPFLIKEKDGKPVNKLFSILLSLFALSNAKNLDNDEITSNSSIIDDFTSILLEGVDNPEIFEKSFRKFIKDHMPEALDDGILDEKEIKEIISRVKIELSSEDRVRIKKMDKQIKKILSQLETRQFLQIMAGSACKANNGTEKNRSFYIYNIEPTTNGIRFIADKYSWVNDRKCFNEQPTTNQFEFKIENRPFH